ncbi:hypothetical protein C7271_21835, partial [filamentous cyanobacterium CCP5]
MFEPIPGLLYGPHLLAQLGNPGVTTPEEAALIFSGPQFFIALLSGLVLAFGFQLLLTNLSLAAGISMVGRGSGSSSSGSGFSGGKIGVAFGLWTLITVSLALFFACLLAVKLSLYNSALLGAITGLVIWGTYFCLMVWVSSTTVGSLIGSVVRKATAGFQALVGTATAAIGAKSASNNIVETAEATAAAVRKELAKGWDGEDLKDTLQDYLLQLRSPEIDTAEIEAEFERLIRQSDLTSLADRDALSDLNRGVFVKLLSDRTDLSRQEVQRVADRLYRSWQRALSNSPSYDPVADLSDYLRSARPEELITERLGQRLDAFLEEYRQRGQNNSSGLLARSLPMLFSVVMGRSDLNDVDVEAIGQQLQKVRQRVGGYLGKSDRFSLVKADVENYLMHTYPWQLQPARLRDEFRQVIHDARADAGILRREIMGLNRTYFADLLSSRGIMTPEEVTETSLQLESVRQEVLREVTDIYRLEAAKDLEHRVYRFLQQTPREELLSDQGAEIFSQVLRDPDASAEDLEDRFTQFGYERFYQILQSRTDLDESERQSLASRLERVMERVLGDARGLQASAQARIQSQWQALQDHLRSTGREELNPDRLKADLRVLLEEPDAGVQRLRQRLAEFDRETLVQLLGQRQDISQGEVERILNQVESSWHQAVNAPAALTAEAKQRYDQATGAIADYLRRTGKPELSPEGIRRDLELLISNPKIGATAMRHRLSEVDRDTLVQLLSQRDDLTEAEVNQIIDDVLDGIRSVLRSPQRLARRVQDQVQTFEAALEDYLRSTDKSELNPEGIKRDLKLLLNDPRLGGRRLRDRLSAMDRDTAVALLAQREDMSREEAEAAVNRVFEVRDEILEQIRNVQDQVKQVIKSILARIRDYLNSLGRPELNYYGIKRDLKQLFDDPQAGAEALQKRLGQVDRGTLVALMSSHDAVSEEDANKVMDQGEAA